MKTTTFTIVGMHCASCVTRNERSLRKFPGTVEAAVNFGTHTATVQYDESRVTETDLFDAIVKNGYKVLTEESAKIHKETIKRELADSKKKHSKQSDCLCLQLSSPCSIFNSLGNC